ncbi:MAG: hypothetical protein AAGA54_16465 [Myxococcota bacterium]
MEGFLLFAGFFAVLNAVTYVVCERRNRAQWSRDIIWRADDPGVHPTYRGGDVEGAAPYVGPEPNPRAPASVRGIAMWSIGMGQMLIPGAAAACFGVIIYGLGLVGIPGCILAARIWALGPALLRADPRAVEKSKSIARFAEVLNGVVLAVALVMLFEGGDLVPLALFTMAYACVSLAHAFAIRRAGEKVAALWATRGYDVARLDQLQMPRRRHARPTA